ncbi:hypothetical protein [Haloferula sp.]|uniref:carboxylesterase family protein n=1 Tax=Haloferula sp. TaxID=2497595 RepID=UPI00329CB92D
MIRSIAYSILGSLLVSGLSAQVGQTRDWTSADGRKITAELISVSEDEIVVRRQGKQVTIKLELLSEDDQAFAKGLLEEDQSSELRSKGFKEGKYADAVKGEWIKYPATETSLLFQLYIGKEVTKKKAGPEVPLFIHLHGAGGRADDVKAGKVGIAAQEVTAEDFYDDFPCVVCVPTCPPEPETWGKQTAKLEALVDDLLATLPIDRKRIYLSGYSQGAQGIGKMLESRPDFYAGAIFADGGPNDKWIGKVKTPLWSYYSPERDSSKAEAWQTGFKEDGVEYRFDRIEDSAHNNIHWKLAKNPEVFQWLFTQTHRAR